jgi:DNA-binding CsgD family transcriptional regulator
VAAIEAPMERNVPLEAFRPYATILTDAKGEVVFCNRKAALLLGSRVRQIVGRRCWEVMGLVDAAGVPFCCASCPVQQQVARGTLEPRHRVIAISARGAPLDLELFTFAIPPRSPGRQPILHLVRPAAIDVDYPAASPELVDKLTSRERQILRLLAAGCDTAAIASRLYISATTVRNHVQHILAKLGVHDRLQAILALLQSRGTHVE